MASKLHQNAILMGCIDSFCLVCESHLWSEQDAVSHIQNPVHIKNLNCAPYLEKYASDHVRKIKRGYYCEFCNVLLPTAAKVGLHITEQSHHDNKGSQLIMRNGNNIIVCNNILISQQAWNGLIMNTCAICNMEFGNLKLHITEQKHVLNLVQKKVEFGHGSIAYRKIDDTSFHCLICNKICALNTVQTHSKDKDHETNVNKCQEFYQSQYKNNNGQNRNGLENGKNDSLQNQNINVYNNTALKETNQVNNVDKIPEKSKYNDTRITINGSDGNNNKIKAKHLKENEKIVDKSTSVQKEKTRACSPAVNQNGDIVNKDVQQTKNQMKKVKNTEIKDKDKLFEHVSDFQKNGVNINFETETAFCKKCFEDVDLDIENIKRHIDQHKSNPKKEATANIVHTMNENHSRTVLNSKDKDNYADSKPSVKFDQNHNVAKSMPKKKDTQEKEEEIIKIDLRKKCGEEIEETDTNNAVTRYIPQPQRAGSAAEPPKSKTSAGEHATKEVLDMNDPETFAKHNSLTFNKGNGNAFCRVCSTRVPAAIKNMKEHVNGMPHKTKVARMVEVERAAKHNIPKKPMGKFIHQHSSVMNVLGVDDVILNDKYCLTRMSFFMITTQNRLRCQACEVTLSESDVSRHVDGAFHERAMERTPVVTCLDSEFVREVRPGLFHCGYCNLIAGAWEDARRHLQSDSHRARARDARRRLADHLPDLRAHREARERLIMGALLQRFWPFL